MDLDVVDIKKLQTVWWNSTPEVQTHAGQECCQKAMNWLVGMSKSFEFYHTDRLRNSGPNWLKNHYTWGPSPWPIHWCEAVKSKHIDCGLFRAFALKIFEAKGVQAFAAQVLRFQPECMTKHWQVRWANASQSFPWASESYVYHEVCAIKQEDDSVEIYDPTDAQWLSPSQIEGLNGHFAIRVETAEVLNWGHYQIGAYQWNKFS